jgi:hypothetical protein
LLQEAARCADLSQREHVTTWMREIGNAFKFAINALEVMGTPIKKAIRFIN